MEVGDAYVFPGFLTPVLTKLFFPKSPTTFLTYFCIGERRKYAGKKSRLKRGSNSQPPDHESDTLTTQPPGRANFHIKEIGKLNLSLCKKATLIHLQKKFGPVRMAQWSACRTHDLVVMSSRRS